MVSELIGILCTFFILCIFYIVYFMYLWSRLTGTISLLQNSKSRGDPWIEILFCFSIGGASIKRQSPRHVALLWSGIRAYFRVIGPTMLTPLTVVWREVQITRNTCPTSKNRSLVFGLNFWNCDFTIDEIYVWQYKMKNTVEIYQD